ncbi:hypothetical protein L6R52_07025 [Myxococcota bacterium]|nr:hypothetical protein [Myxococcota bacterium]
MLRVFERPALSRRRWALVMSMVGLASGASSSVEAAGARTTTVTATAGAVVTSTRASEPPALDVPSPQPDVQSDAAPRAADTLFASEWTDTRLTFALSTIDLFAGPGERLGRTSGLRLGVDERTNLPFENLDTRYSGFESLTHLVLHESFDGKWPLWSADAALSIAAIANPSPGSLGLVLSDAGSHVRIVRRPAAGREDDVGAIDLTAWPLSSDRFRLGYTYRISWGGTSIFPGQLARSAITEGAVPGARLAWRAPEGRAYAFVGAKSALLVSREAGVRAGEWIPNWGGLAGAGVELTDALIAEVNGGVFEKGTQERTGLEGRAIIAWGASARVTLHEGPVLEPTSPDLQPAGQQPQLPHRRAHWVPYVPGTGYSVALEGTFVRQNLEDPDAFGTETHATGLAAALVARVKKDRLLIGLDAIVRTADFLVFDVPGYVPFQARSDATETKPSTLIAISAAYGLASFPMRPKLTLGVELPATVRGPVPDGLGGPATPGDERTIILVDEAQRIVLPPGIERRSVLGLLLELPIAIADEVTLAAELRWARDPNQPRLTQDVELGEVTYTFDAPDRLGLAVVLRARW